jgi:hypothetical protein
MADPLESDHPLQAEFWSAAATDNMFIRKRYAAALIVLTIALVAPASVHAGPVATPGGAPASDSAGALSSKVHCPHGMCETAAGLRAG